MPADYGMYFEASLLSNLEIVYGHVDDGILVDTASALHVGHHAYRLQYALQSGLYCPTWAIITLFIQSTDGYSQPNPLDINPTCARRIKTSLKSTLKRASRAVSCRDGDALET